MPEYRFVGEVAEHFLHPEIGTLRPGQRVRTTEPVEHARLKRVAPLPRRPAKPRRGPKARPASNTSQE